MARATFLRAGWAIAVLWLGSFAASARADDLESFEAARQAYVSQSFALAVQRFEALVGGDMPTLSNRPLVLESRKYLAAAYLFIDRRADAERQFELLIEDDPSYEIDPLAFPAEVVDTFAAVRRRVEVRRREREESARRAEELARRQEADRLLRDRERVARLVELASTETDRVEHSRLVGIIPFGVGQFQNGHDGAGAVFAVSEAVLAATSIVTYVLHESIRDDVRPLAVGATEPPDRQDARTAAAALRVTNWVSTGLLAAVVVAGIVDAQVRFVPVVERSRRRELPPELLEGWSVETVGDLGLGARLAF